MRCVFTAVVLIAALAAPAMAGTSSSGGGSSAHVSAPVHVTIPTVGDPHHGSNAKPAGDKHAPKALRWTSAFAEPAADYMCWTTVYQQNGPYLVAHQVLTQGVACSYNQLFWSTRLDSGGLMPANYPAVFEF